RNADSIDKIAVSLKDLTPTLRPSLLAIASTPPPTTQNAGGLDWISSGRGELRTAYPLFVFGRAYAVVIRSTPAFYAAHPMRVSDWAAFAGLLLTVVLTAFVGFLRNRQVFLERQVEARTAELHAREATLHSITDSARDAILMMDPQGRISFWNPAAEQIFGYTGDEAIGRELHLLLAPERYYDAHLKAFPEFRRSGHGNAVGKTVGLHALRKDGTEIAVALSLSAVSIRGKWYAVGVVRDETERQAREQELRRLATTDPLTGLANRRHFLVQVEHELERFQRYAKPAALLMLDLDHFKQVNDHHGHASGDWVLQHFAAVAQQTLRKVDLIGRLGGEEFAALLPSTDEEGALLLAERLRECLATSPATGDAGEIFFTVSIGLASFAATDRTANMILARADRALYRAKEAGRNRVEVEPVP
ncbi:MAG: diguanylate cyclase, partial [Candidatus Competibacter sp.]